MTSFTVLAAAVLLLGSAVSGQEIDWTKVKPKHVYVPVVGQVPDSGIVPRITGGRVATRGQFPWQVALFMDSRSFCGGSLVTSTLVISAAHCTHNARNVLVFLGSHLVQDQFEANRVAMTAQRFASHPKYTQNRVLDYDLSIVRLPKVVAFNTYIKPIRLPKVTTVLPTYEGYRARASGWGQTKDGVSEISTQLRYVDLTIISNAACAKVFGPAINADKMCVSTTGGASPCNGDSGGPLVIQENDRNFTLVGVVSFGSARGCTVGTPSAFTRLTSYIQDPFLTKELY